MGMDAVIGGVIETLKAANLWDNTLLVFSSDNGGSLELSSTAGNNFPLRGGKTSTLEGGVRATSFVSGGYLPQERAGDIEMGLIHLADWYATFCALAGVDASDDYATEHGLPSVDGLNMWPLISGQVSESPRTELAISHDTFIWNEYKLLTGSHRYAVWQSSMFPNSSSQTQEELQNTILNCGQDGCLFNVVNDPSEYDDLSQLDAYSDVLEEMKNKLDRAREGIWSNEQESENLCPQTAEYDDVIDSCGCWMAVHRYNGFIGPYQTLTEDVLILNEAYEIGMHQDITNENEYLYLMAIFLGFAVLIFGIRNVFVNQEKIPNKNVHNISYGSLADYSGN